MNFGVIEMLVKRAIGERGQFVVPKDIREQLGLRPGTEVTVEVKGNEMVVKPAKSVDEFLKEFFTSSKTVKVKDGAAWIRKAIDEEHDG